MGQKTHQKKYLHIFPSCTETCCIGVKRLLDNESIPPIMRLLWGSLVGLPFVMHTLTNAWDQVTLQSCESLTLTASLPATVLIRCGREAVVLG